MRRAVSIVVLVAAALTLTLALTWSRQGRLLSEALSVDVQQVQARTFSLSAASAPGEVFECIGPLSDIAPELSPDLRSLSPAVLAITRGGAPISSLSAAHRAELDSHAEWFAKVLRCGERSTVAPVAGIGPYAELLHGRRQSMPRMMDTLSSMAPLTMRTQLEAGQNDLVLQECGELLVLSIGWLRLEGLESMLPTLGVTGPALSLCESAVEGASPDARAAWLRRVKDLQSLAPTFAQVMELERTQTALRLFGAWLPADVNGTLPREAQLVTKTQREGKWDRGLLATLALRLYWKRFDPGMRAVEASTTAADASAAQKQLEAPFLRKFLAADPVDLRYDMYFGYVVSLHANLRRLAEH